MAGNRTRWWCFVDALCPLWDNRNWWQWWWYKNASVLFHLHERLGMVVFSFGLLAHLT
jgi:hypothetical protein